MAAYSWKNRNRSTHSKRKPGSGSSRNDQYNRLGRRVPYTPNHHRLASGAWSGPPGSSHQQQTKNRPGPPRTERRPVARLQRGRMGRVTGRDRQQSQREGWAFRPNRGRWQSGKDFSGGGRRNPNQNRSFNAGHQQHSARGEQAHYKGAHQDKNQEWPASTVHRHEHATSSRSSVQSKQTEGSTADKGTSSVPGGRKKKAPSLDDLISQAVEKVMQMDTVSGAENSDHASDQVPVDSGQMGSAQDGDADTKTKSRQSRWDVGPADSSPQALIITVPPACPKGSAAQATATHAPHKRSSAQAAATHAWTKGSISQATATHTPHKGSIAQATIQASPKGSMSQAAATHIPSRGSVAQASSTHARPRGSNTKAKTDHAPNKGSFAQATSTHTPPKWSTAQATSTHTSPKGSVAQTTSTHDPPRGSVAPVTSTHAPPKVSVAKGPTAHVLSQTAVVKIHPANTAPKELIVSTPPAATPPKGLVTKVPPAETTLKGSVVNIHPAKSIPKGLVTHTPPANIPPKGSVTNMPAANTPPKGLVANTPPANTPPRRLVANTPTANTPPKGLVASTSPANIPPKGLVASTPSANTPPKGLVANTPSANTPPKGLVASFSPADTPPKGQAANIPPALPTGSVTKALSVQASQKWPVKTPVSKTPSTDTCPPKSVARDKSGQLPSKQTEGSARDSLQKHHGRDDIQRQEYSNNQTAAEVPQAQRLLAFPGSGSHLVSDRSSSQVKGDFGSVAERLLNLSGSLEPAKQDPEVAISELTKKLKSLTDALPTPSDDALAALTPLPDPVCSSTPNIDNSSEEKLAALKTRHKRKKNNTVVPISNLTSVFRAVVDSPAVLAWKEETDECSSNDSTVMDLGHVAEPETKENFAGQIVGEDNDGKDKRQTCQEETPKKSEEEAACTAVFKKKVKRLPKPLIPEEMDKKDTGSDHAEKILEHISPVTPQTTTLLVNAPPKEKRGEISACMPAKGVITAQMSTAFVNTAPKEKMVGDTHGPAKDVITCQISTAFMNTAPKEKTGEIAQGKPALGAIPAQKTTTLANTSPKEKTAGKNVPPESAQGVIPSQKTIFVNTPSKEKTEGEIAPCEPAQGVIAPQMTTALLNTPSKDKMAGKTFPLGPAQSVITSHKTMSVTTPSKGETVGETCQREPFQGVISSQMATMSQDIPPKQKTPKPAGVAVTSQMTTLVNTPSLEKTVGETFLHEPVQDGASPQMTTLLKTPSKEKTAAKTFPPEPAGAAVTSQMTKLVNTPSKEKTVGETFPFEPVQDVASPKVTLLKTPPKEKTAAKNVPPEPAQGVITSQKTILVNTPSKEKVAEETFPCELVQDVTPQMTSAFVNTSPKEKTVGKTFPLKSAQDVVPQMTTASVNTPPKEKTEGKICPLEPAEGAAPVKPSSVRRRVWIKTKHTASGQVSPGRMIKSSGTPVTQSKTDRRFVKIKSPKESFKLVYSKDCSQDTGAGSNTHGKREGQGTKISPEQGKMHTDSALDIVAASPIKGQPQPVDLNFSSFFPHSQAEERSIVKSLADKCSEITPDPHSRAVSHESVSRLAETEMRVSTQTATPSTQCELKCVDAVEQTEVGSIQTDSDLKSPSKEPSPALAEQQCDREVNSDLPGLEDISPNGSFVFEDNDLEELPMMTQGDSAEDSPGKEINTSQRSLVSLDLSESADSSKASKTADERKTSKDEAQPTSGQSTLLSENLERQVARRQSRGAAAKRPRKGSITNLNQRDKLKALFSVRRRGSVKQTARPDCSATGLTSLTRNDDTPAAKVVTSPTFDLQHQDVKKVGGNAKPVTLPDSNSQEKYELALLLSTAVKRCEGLESDKTALNKPGALLSSATVETGKAVSVEPAASVSTVMAGYAVSSSTQQAASLTGSGSANPVLMEADTSSGTAMEGCDEPGSGENGSPLTASAEKNEVLPAAGAQSVPDGNVDHVFMENTPVSACMLACEKPISEGVDYPETRTRSGELEKGKLREPTVPLNIDVQSSTEVMSVSGGNATSMNRDRSSAHTAEQLSCSSDNISLSQEPVTANAGQGHSQMNTHSQLSSLTSKTSQGEEYIDDDDILRDIDSCLESSDTFLVDGSKPAGADVNSIEGVAAMSTSRENTVDLYANVTHRVKEQTSTLNLNGEDLLEAVETVSQVDPKNTGPSSSSARPESSSKKTADGSLPQGNICLHAAPDSNDCSKPNPPCKASDSDTCETNTDSVFSVAGHGADPPRSGADQPRQDVCQTVNFTITTTPEDVQQKKTTLVPVKSLGQSKHPPQPSVRLEQDPSGMTEVSISVDIIDSKAEDSQEEDASSVTNCSVGKTEHPDSAQAGDQLTRSPMETGDGEDFVTTYVTLNVPREKSLEICLEPMLQAGHLSGDKDIEIEVMAGKSGSAGAVRVVDSGCSHPNTTACGVHTVLAGTDSVETNQRQEKHSTLGKASIIAESCAAQNKTKLQSLSCNTSQAAEKGESLKLGLQERSSEKPTLPGNKLSDPGPLNSESSKVINAGSKVESCVTRENDTSESSETTQKHQTPVRTATKVTPGHSPTSPPLLTRCDQDNTSPNMTGSPPLLEPQSTPGTPKQHRPPIPLLSPGSEQGLIQNCPTKNMTGVVVNGPDVVVGMSSSNQDACGTVSSSPSEPACGMSGDWNGSVENVVYTTENGDGSLQNILVTGEDDGSGNKGLVGRGDGSIDNVVGSRDGDGSGESVGDTSAAPELPALEGQSCSNPDLSSAPDAEEEPTTSAPSPDSPVMASSAFSDVDENRSPVTDDSDDSLSDGPDFLTSGMCGSSPLSSIDMNALSPTNQGFLSDVRPFMPVSHAEQSTTFSLDSLLRDTKIVDAEQHEHKIMQAELRKDLLSGRDLVIEDNETDEGEDDMFTEEQRLTLMKLQLEEEEIKDSAPGESVLHDHLYGQLFTEAVSPRACGVIVNGNSHSFLSLLFQPYDLMDILSTDIISLAYDSLPCKPEILRWLFFIMTVHGGALEMEKCSDQLLQALQWQMWDIAQGKDKYTWAPDILDLIRVFVNWGAEMENILFNSTVGDPQQLEETLPLCEQPAPRIDLAPCHRNFEALFKVLSSCLQARPNYSAGELNQLLLMLCKVSLHPALCKSDLHNELQVCLSSILNTYQPSQWTTAVPWLCRKLSGLSSHHHNQVYLVQLFKATCVRGQYLQQRLAFLLLHTALLQQPLSDQQILLQQPLSDQQIQHFQLLDLLVIIPEMKKLLSADNYRFASLVHLLDLSVGPAAHHLSQRKQLFRLLEAVRLIVSEIRDSMQRLDCTKVKGMLLHLCLKWDLAIKANNIKQRKIFNCFTSRALMQVEQLQDQGQASSEEEEEGADGASTHYSDEEHMEEEETEAAKG